MALIDYRNEIWSEKINRRVVVVMNSAGGGR